MRAIAEGLAALGLQVLAFNHEFMNSQYEINLRHTEALLAADRALRLKAAVKDIAAQHELVATFMGKPFNDEGGSGTHIHVSLNRDERNAFDAPAAEDGVSAELRAFTAGVLAHAASLMALLNPTVNSYRRIQPDSLAPTHANWGWGNRGTGFCIRRSAGRPRASRSGSPTAPRTLIWRPRPCWRPAPWLTGGPASAAPGRR